ncbi:hypothetical protein [Lachnoclostridium sp. Marseille-P6806]|uniref:hypothetical protein n=1 Tax=Lachnoclostridium sp. Marseille-P6806 TaxID=2364793 RepID=UPI00102FC362|nr:hypothetical protein [Lachnoclostridium sp. Marseille-P6806]
MKYRKSISLILTAAMLGVLTAGCGSAPGAAASGAEAETEAAPADGQAESGAASDSGYTVQGSKTYNMFMRSTYVTWIKDQKWYDEAEKRLGVSVNYIEGPDEFDDVYAEIDQRVTSHTLEDASMCELSQAKVYGEQGAFVDLTPYIAKYAPDYQKYIDENPDYKAYITAGDGGIYGLVKETPELVDVIGYRADQFEKAGVDASQIKTIDDFTATLETLKDYYGKDNPSYYPLTGRDSALRFAAWFGASSYVDADGAHGVYYTHEKDGNFDIKSENAYTMVETMKKWYDEGLINPQWIAGTFSEGDWEQAMLGGDGSVFYDYYARPQWFMDNGGTDADAGYQMAVLDFLQDENGKVMPVTTCPTWQDGNATAISSDCSEDTIATILGFINYFYTEEGKLLASYGVEGESFEYDDQGEPQFPDGLYHQEESKPDGEKKWSFLSDRFTVCKPVDNSAFFKWNDELVSEAMSRLLKDENIQPVATINYTTEELSEMVSLVATVYDAQVAGLTAFITGDRELTEANYQAFVDEMDGLGLSRIEEIEAAAYNETQASVQ